MKLLLSITLGVLLTAQASAQELTINVENAEIKFDFLSKETTGSISGFEATINFDPNDLSGASIVGSVDVSTIETGNQKRDDHLRVPDYFDVKKHPKMTFTSKTFEKTENGYDMIGTLKIKEVEHEVTFQFTFSDKTFKGTSTIYTNDFDLMVMKEREESQVNIEIVIPVN